MKTGLRLVLPMPKAGPLLVMLMLTLVGMASSQTLTPPPKTPASSAQQTGTRLILLGTGGGPAIRVLRSEPANLLVVDGRPYLIDCGEGTVTRLQQVGFQASDIERVFLTHLHVDHTSGLSSLLTYNWTSGRPQPVEIYGPPGTDALMKAALNYMAIPMAIQGAEFPPNYPDMMQLVHAHDANVTVKSLVYQDDKVRVFAVQNTHYSLIHMAEPNYGPLRSYAFRFETAERTIVFTGDTGPSDAVADLAAGADILVSEVVSTDLMTALLKKAFNASDQQLSALITHMKEEHLTPAEVGELAAKARVKMVVLSHFVPGADDELDSNLYVAGVRAYFKGPVVAGHDLDQF